MITQSAVTRPYGKENPPERVIWGIGTAPRSGAARKPQGVDVLPSRCTRNEHAGPLERPVLLSSAMVWFAHHVTDA